MKSPMAIGPEASNYLKPHDLSNGRIVQSIVSTPPHPPPSPPLSSPNLSLLISAAARTTVSVCYYTTTIAQFPDQSSDPAGGTDQSGFT